MCGKRCDVYLVQVSAVRRQAWYTSHRLSTSAVSDIDAGDDDELVHHAYTFIRRTLGFGTAGVPSRLFLAAVYAATHCDVPLPQLGMTGGEHALQLLRQSWVNRPLSGAEASALDGLQGFAGHTPALQLLCRGACEEANLMAFLQMRPAQPGRAECSSQRDAHCMYE